MDFKLVGVGTVQYLLIIDMLMSMEAGKTAYVPYYSHLFDSYRPVSSTLPFGSCGLVEVQDPELSKDPTMIYIEREMDTLYVSS